jgi:perosamine synthetase
MSDRHFIDVFKPVIYPEAIERAVSTLQSGWVGVGPQIAEFERRFSAFTGARYCVAVNCGTSAIHLALELLELPVGSKVLVSDISHIGVLRAIQMAGLEPLFADVEPTTGNILVDSVNEKVNESAAILCTHVAGYPCDLDGLRGIARKRDLPLIEDCSHAIGSSYRGRQIGDGVLCCFSLSFPKAITGVEGGVLVTNNKEYAEKARTLRNLGMFDGVKFSDSFRVKVSRKGFRYNWNDLMASIAIMQMDNCEKDNKRREFIAYRYVEGLRDIDGIYMPSYYSDRMSSYFFMPLFFERRDSLVNKLRAHGIGTRIYFPSLSRVLGSDDHLPGSSWYDEHELTLPINVSMSYDDQEQVISVVREGW